MGSADDFFKARDALFKDLGFKPDWVMCSLDDCREMYWEVTSTEVIYGPTKYSISDENRSANKPEDYYSDDIYFQRFYKKHVYRGKEVTMIMCDPHVDGCKWFRIFDNNKEVK